MNNFYFDCHSHLSDPRFDQTIDTILKKAKKNNITHVVNCAIDEQNWKKSLKIKSFQSLKIIHSFGVHPWFIESLSSNWKKKLTELMNRKEYLIGECGLDLIHSKTAIDKQKEILNFHLKLSHEYKKPITLHIVKGWNILLDSLKFFGPLPSGGLIHSFSGHKNLIPALLKYNLRFSYSSQFMNPKAKKIQKSLIHTPLEFLLFETDSPDQLSEYSKHSQNNLNEPSLLPETISHASQLMNISEEKLTKITYENSLKLFV